MNESAFSVCIAQIQEDLSPWLQHGLEAHSAPDYEILCSTERLKGLECATPPLLARCHAYALNETYMAHLTAFLDYRQFIDALGGKWHVVSGAKQAHT